MKNSIPLNFHNIFEVDLPNNSFFLMMLNMMFLVYFKYGLKNQIIELLCQN